jgi:hypothetical protein
VAPGGGANGVVHLLRASFRYAGRQHWDAIAKALKPVYTAPTEAAARARFDEFTEVWGGKYPAIVRLWENARAELVPGRPLPTCGPPDGVNVSVPAPGWVRRAQTRASTGAGVRVRRRHRHRPLLALSARDRRRGAGLPATP